MERKYYCLNLSRYPQWQTIVLTLRPHHWSINFITIYGVGLYSPGLPNVRPRGRIWPPGPFYAAPLGCENYYCFLLIVHFYIYIADFLFCASELPVCLLHAYTLSLVNQCRPTIV